MSTIQVEWPGPIRSLGEIFALAQALETEAAARYAELASSMRALGLPDVASVFDALVAEEEEHAAAVEQWARAETGARPDPEQLRWRPPESFDEEAARTIASSRLASAYRALSLAVRNEERAFLLWTHIAAQAEDAKIREAAERMALEELRHAATLRRERRRAFHAARAAGRASPPRSAAMARDVELALAGGLARLAGSEALAARAPELRRLAAEAEVMAAEAGAAVEQAPAAVPEEDSLAGMRRLAERAAELYLDAADTAREEQALLRVQSLADRAIARIARLGAMDRGD